MIHLLKKMKFWLIKIVFGPDMFSLTNLNNEMVVKLIFICMFKISLVSRLLKLFNTPKCGYLSIFFVQLKIVAKKANPLNITFMKPERKMMYCSITCLALQNGSSQWLSWCQWGTFYLFIDDLFTAQIVVLLWLSGDI